MRAAALGKALHQLLLENNPDEHDREPPEFRPMDLEAWKTKVAARAPAHGYLPGSRYT